MTSATDDNHNLIIFSGIKQDLPELLLWNDLYTFDSAKWTKHKDAPAEYARREASGVYYGGSLWVFGGCDIKYRYTDTLFQYNFETEEWSQVKASGTGLARWKHTAAVTSDGKMYVYGGNDGSKFVSGLVYFDIPTKTWHTVTQKGDVPQPRSLSRLSFLKDGTSQVLALFGGLFHYGGFNGYCQPDLYFFDITTAEWKIAAPVSSASPQKRTGHAVSVIDQRYYVFGGYSDRFLADSHFWDLSTKSWSTEEKVEGEIYPVGLYGAGMSCRSTGADSATCYAFGGTNGTRVVPYLDTFWQIDLLF